MFFFLKCGRLMIIQYLELVNNFNENFKILFCRWRIDVSFLDEMI